MTRRGLARGAPGLALVVALVAGGILGNTLLLAQADETLPVGRLSARLDRAPADGAPDAGTPGPTPPAAGGARPAGGDPLPERRTSRSATETRSAAESPPLATTRDQRDSPARPSSDDDHDQREVEADD